MAEQGQGYCKCGNPKCPGNKKHLKKKLKKRRRRANRQQID